MGHLEKTKEELLNELQALHTKLSKVEDSWIKSMRKEEKLSELNLRLRSLLNNSPDVFFFNESQNKNHIVLTANRALDELFELMDAEVSGKADKRFLAPDLSRYCRPNDLAVISGQDIRTEEEITGADGAKKTYEVIKSPLYDDLGVVLGLVEIRRDVTEKKRTEERLRESEGRFRAIFDNAADGMLLAEIDDKRIRLGNKAASAMLGYAQEEMTRLRAQDIYPPQALTQVMEQFGLAIKGQPSFMRDIIIRKKDGASACMDVNSAPVTVAGKRYLLSIFRDTTERRKAEQKLRILSYAVEQSPTSVVITDAHGNVEYINSQFTKLTGYAPEDILGKSLGILRSGKHSPQYYRALRSAIMSGKVWRDDICSRKKNGELVWQLISISPIRDSQGKITHFVSVTIDDTERRRTERALKENKEFAESLIGSMKDGINIIDHNGVIMNVNQAFCRMTGFTRDELAGSSMPYPYWPDDEREKIQAAYNNVLSGVLEDFETVYRRKNGERYPVLVSPSVIKDKTGRTVCYFMSVKDLSERKKLEEELLKSQKLESVGLLAGGIAHAYNNLLTGILGNVTLTKMSLQPGDRMLKKLEQAESAIFQAKELTQQLLTFSKGGTPIKKPLSVAKLIKDSASFVVRGSGVKFEYKVPDDLYQIDADGDQIRQAIYNIIINADQAMPHGGTIRVKCENMTIGSTALPHLKEGRYVKITVEDEGVGIPEENLPKIFDPFFTTKEKNSGLGLAAAYSIVKNHGGSITAASEPGAGTVFNIYLPASKTEAPKKSAEEKAPITGKGKVLVMDDEKMIRDVLGELLGLIGYEPEFAVDGVEAIERYLSAKDSGAPFDALIMDLMIPGSMGGMEAIKKLLEIDPGVKAIVLSGYSNDPTISDFRKYGFCGVITKPFKLVELSQVLHGVVSSKTSA